VCSSDLSDYVGPVVVGLFGLYLLVRAVRTDSPEGLDYRWAVFGLPIPLSIDNFVGGTSLGLLGFPPLFSSALFGAITAVMSFAGLQLGRIVSHLIRIRYDLLAGVAMVIAAIVLALVASHGATS
jgi:putative Mn2+ efflux pump MntP